MVIIIKNWEFAVNFPKCKVNANRDLQRRKIMELLFIYGWLPLQIGR